MLPTAVPFPFSQCLDTLGQGRKELTDLVGCDNAPRKKSQKENIGNMLKDNIPNFAKDRCIFTYFSVSQESALCREKLLGPS